MEQDLTIANLRCRIGRRLIVLLASCLLLSCADPLHYRVELTEIILQDFSDLPTVNIVKPVYAYANWVVGKDSIFHQVATNETYWAPPITPDDTTLIYQAELPQLKELLFGGSKEGFSDFNQMIARPFGGDLLSNMNEVELITELQVCSRLKALGLPEEHCTNAFYVFSEPICDSSKTRCLVYVDRMAGWDSAGWRMIYERQGEVWVRIYEQMLWVS